MAIGDAYITRAQLGAYLGIPTMSVADDKRDAKLDSACAAATTAINDHCRRQFQKDSSATARVYRPTATRLLIVDDFYDVASLVIQKKSLGGSYGSAWSANDFELEPLNGVVNGQPGHPYRRIALNYWFWMYSIDRVQVTAKWGWANVPASVIQAAYIIGAQYVKLADAPLGVAGFGSGGDGFAGIKVRDVPQAWSLLCPYVVDRISVD